MEFIVDFLSTVFIFIAALFILVMVHELGHFLAARLFKMRVERFSIGFPPRVWGVKKGDTDYCISATPLGGYVKISGMIDESMDTEFLDAEPKPWEFRAKPVWQRIIVISAGVIFNLILAAIIYVGITYSYGNTVLPAQNVGSLFIPDTSLAYTLGFRTGDRVLQVNGEEIKDFNGDIFSITNLTSEELTFTVLREGQEHRIKLPENFLDQLNREKQPLFSVANAIPSIISGIVEDSPAEKVGLQSDDRIVAINGEEVSYWLQVVSAVRGSSGAIALSVSRNGDLLELEVMPDSETKTIGIYPVDLAEYFGVQQVYYSFFESIPLGIQRTGETLQGIIGGLRQLVTGAISVQDNLGGPIAIASVTRQVTDSGGLRGFWIITAYLSITLAVMNILPLPVLDGGHLVFLIYEGITRREPSAKFRIAMQQIGLILIILIFLFVTYNDIMRVAF